MLRVRDLNVSIQGVPILNEVNIDLDKGTMVGLIGRNGAGKTSLMKSIMGILQPESGKIIFDDKDLTKVPPHKRAHYRIGYMPEDRRLVQEFTVEENILVPLWATSKKTDSVKIEWVYSLIPEIARFSNRQALSLSGGQQKLVALARALVCGSQMLILDEPFEGVAPALAQRLMEVISNLKNEDLTVLISESDYTHSQKVVDAVYSIERGHINKMSDSAL